MLATRANRAVVTSRADAFAALTDRHLDESYRLAAVILGDAVEAEDAVHDAAVVAWRSFGQLRDPGRFDAWFGRIVVNVCRDRLRARRRRQAVKLVPPDDPTDTSTHAAIRDAIERAFAVLDPEEQIVVVLRFWHDLTVEQVANRLGIPAGTVKSRLHKALGRLRAAIRAGEATQ